MIIDHSSSSAASLTFKIKSESEHKGGAVPGVTDEEMWHAQFMVDSAVHPDTNELVPKPFRMAGYVPCNIPILVGLLIPQGVAMTAFWVSFSAISPKNTGYKIQNAVLSVFSGNAIQKRKILSNG